MEIKTCEEYVIRELENKEEELEEIKEKYARLLEKYFILWNKFSKIKEKT